MVAVSVNVKLQLNLDKIKPDAVMRDALQFLGNSAAKAGREHTEKVFPTPGGKFLAGGIKASRPRKEQGELVVRVGPIGRALKSGILPEQEEPTTFRLEDPVKRLGVGSQLAIPVTEKRSARGKVRRTPAKLLGPGGKGFVSQSGKAIVVKSGGKKNPKFAVAFALAEQARTPGELNLVKTMVSRANERANSVFETVLEKHLQRTNNK